MPLRMFSIQGRAERGPASPDGVTQVRSLTVTRVDLVDEGGSLDKATGQGAHVLLYKRAAGAGGGTMAIDVSKLPKDVQDHLAALEKRALDADRRAADAEAKAGAPPPEKEADKKDVWKGVHPAVRQQYEEQKAKTAQAEEFAKAQQEARVKGEYITKAAAFVGLPVKPDDDWIVLRAIDERLEPEVATRVNQLLKIADEAMIKAGLFRAIGVPGSRPEPESAEAKILARAEDLVRKGEAKSKEAAVAAVAKANPELYTAYREEMRTRRSARS